MAENNCQKIKLLKLWELLRQETDEEHPMRTSAVCDRLVAMGISCDRRTLHKDMKLLNEQGYEVYKIMIDHECAYYVTERSFTVPELKVLIDAVQAANFIPEKWTQDLIAKIADLGGSHRAEVLQGNIVKFNTSKHMEAPTRPVTPTILKMSLLTSKARILLTGQSMLPTSPLPA